MYVMCILVYTHFVHNETIKVQKELHVEAQYRGSTHGRPVPNVIEGLRSVAHSRH